MLNLKIVVVIVSEYNFLTLLYINLTIIPYPIQVRCIDNNNFIIGNLRERAKINLIRKIINTQIPLHKEGMK